MELLLGNTASIAKKVGIVEGAVTALRPKVICCRLKFPDSGKPP
jgi:hypothetical protein